MAAIHSVSDLVSNEETEHLQHEKPRMKARWWLCAVNEDGPS